MPRVPASESSSRTRPKDPDHPIAAYIRERRKAVRLNKARFAELMDATKGAVSQWEDGQAHPRAEQLIAMSLRCRVSLGRLTTLAATRNGVGAPRGAEIEGRLALIPPLLLDGVVSAVEAAERMAKQLPDGAFKDPVPNERLNDWSAAEKRAQTPKR